LSFSDHVDLSTLHLLFESVKIELMVTADILLHLKHDGVLICQYLVIAQTIIADAVLTLSSILPVQQRPYVNLQRMGFFVSMPLDS
ncbi:hypothetical protein, partial [Escherichia coli]|uniref:hypothetical protein n=1 Tax=Escherichia coli TaxID=562 RepID=UPI00159B89B1